MRPTHSTQRGRGKRKKQSNELKSKAERESERGEREKRTYHQGEEDQQDEERNVTVVESFYCALLVLRAKRTLFHVLESLHPAVLVADLIRSIDQSEKREDRLPQDPRSREREREKGLRGGREARS
jgi:hypothetical protein